MRNRVTPILHSAGTPTLNLASGDVDRRRPGEYGAEGAGGISKVRT
jgi:hypothetical protein